ncbi:sulfur carrier protein ThiS [Nocardioides bruguierae]|uniref:sulfur carrier protein ThiS n=1 Tax=Nocardioides bruguierae TaxID=2945102 RepID=UPI002022828F|nr:sulfur carrier protein ThiS [Nocardioides bruguierae]MCL8025800.1 sulfur carrier protein ThiS [Nocardioides bruguierae]
MTTTGTHPPRTVEVHVNGRPRLLPAGSTVADLVPDPTGLAVAVGERVVPRAEHAGLELRTGDVVEVVGAVQGG